MGCLTGVGFREGMEVADAAGAGKKETIKSCGSD